MLNIYAHSMLTATRAPCVTLRDVPSPSPNLRQRWFARRKTRCVDPAKL